MRPDVSTPMLYFISKGQANTYHICFCLRSKGPAGLCHHKASAYDDTRVSPVATAPVAVHRKGYVATGVSLPLMLFSCQIFNQCRFII